MPFPTVGLIPLKRLALLPAAALTLMLTAALQAQSPPASAIIHQTVPAREQLPEPDLAALEELRSEYRHAAARRLRENREAIWSIGMDAVIERRDIKGASDVATLIRAPLPQLRVGRRVRSDIQIDGLMSYNHFKPDGQSAFTEATVGIQPIKIFGDAASEYGNQRFRPFVGVGAILKRETEGDGDESTTRFGGHILAGVQRHIGSGMMLRVNGFFGQLGSDGHYESETYYGLSTGMSCDWPWGDPAESGHRHDGRGLDFRIGSGFFFERRNAFTHSSKLESSSFMLPAPYVGVWMPFRERFHLGANLGFQRQSWGDYSGSSLQLSPGVDYTILPPDRRLNVRVGAFGSFDRETVDLGVADASDIITGYGARAALTFPVFGKHLGALGFEYRATGESEKFNRGKTTNYGAYFELGHFFRF